MLFCTKLFVAIYVLFKIFILNLCLGDGESSEAESQTESACTETSSLHGIFSK